MKQSKLSSIITLSLLLMSASQAYANTGALTAFDAQLEAVSFDDVMQAKEYRESEAGAAFSVETQGQFAGPRSDLKISEEAKKLIIHFEVSGKSNYENKLVNPTWPGGESGATVGIGFDLGYSKAKAVEDAWGEFIPKSTVQMLMMCVGKTNVAGKECTKQIKSAEIKWLAANQQFEYYLPFIIAQTRGKFKNFDLLPPSSRGALVSLVYNRGASTSNTPRRVEMYNISILMKDKRFSEIPAQILKMQRLWPNIKGLLARRKLEAELFSMGLSENENQ